MQMPDGLSLGYVLKRFPRLSETFVLNEILELERQGHRVEVFSLLRPPLEERHGLVKELKARITYLPSAGGLMKTRLHEGLEEEPVDLGTALAGCAAAGDPVFNNSTAEEAAALQFKAASVAALAQARGVDHLHAHFASDAATVALLASRLSGIPFSFTAHARDIYHQYKSIASDNAMRRAKIAEADFVATVSDYNRAHLRQVAPSHGARVWRLYNGIDLGRFTPMPVERRPGQIVAVGRLIEKKGFSDLIKACAILRDNGVKFHCSIIGDGPLRSELDGQIRLSSLAPDVEIAGPQPQERLIGMVRQASVAVLPCIVSESGDRDGLPTVLLEAMALGLPVVTTSVSGGPEIVAHGETGLVVEPGDTTALAASIETLLENPALAERMGAAGRKRAESLFSLQTNVATLGGWFRQAASIDRTLFKEAV
ncbi:MAG: glycosyltransferase family 4 protein [Rhizobiaceae bacterium]